MQQLTAVTDGLEYLAETYRDNWDFNAFAVADIGRVGDVFPELDESRVWRMDLSSFLDEQGNFEQGLAKRLLEWRIKKKGNDLPDLVVGAVATDSQFFDREDIIDEFWSTIEQGRNILLAAPRRFGKTSLVRHIIENPRPGFNTCYVDLEGGSSAGDFIRLIIQGLLDNLGCRDCLPQAMAIEPDSQNIMEGEKGQALRRISHDLAVDWRAVADEVFTKLNEKNERCVLVLDEFSWLLEEIIARQGADPDEAQQLLNWFGEVRGRMNNLKVVVTGSDHLESFLAAMGLDGRFDDLSQIVLPPYSADNAELFSLLAMTKAGVAVTPSDLGVMMGLMGKPIPYFLQIFLDLLQGACQRGGQLDARGIENVYYEKLLGVEAKRYFEYLEHQISRYSRYRLNTDQVRKVLFKLSENEYMDSADFEALWDQQVGGRPMAYLVALLENDFFLLKKDGQVSLACKFIRDYFRQKDLWR